MSDERDEAPADVVATAPAWVVDRLAGIAERRGWASVEEMASAMLKDLAGSNGDIWQQHGP